MVPPPLDFGQRIADLVAALFNGVHGILGDTGQVGPYNSGILFGSAQVFLFMVFSVAPRGALLGTSQIDPYTLKEINPSFW